MSLREIATVMKKKGRGPDTELVHMAPREVAGLRALAKAHGGNLTVNPDTGLPEAGFLESILPTLVGAGLAVVSGGTLIPVLAAAATGALVNKEDPLTGAITGGMGGFGGAGIANAFAGAAGAAGTAAAADAAGAAATDAAATTTVDAAATAAAEQTASASAEQLAAQQAQDLAAQEAAQQVTQEQAAQAAAQEANYVKVGRGAQNVFTGEEGAAESFIGKPATATTAETGLGGWSGAGSYAMKAAAPLLAAQNDSGGGTADARGIMNSMREGTAPINMSMRDMGEDEEFNAARRKAASPGGNRAGLGALDSFNKRPWYYEQKAASGGVLRLNTGGLSITQTPQTNAAIMPYGGGDGGLGLAALAARVKRYQMPIEDQIAAASAAQEPVAPVAAPLGSASFNGRSVGSGVGSNADPLNMVNSGGEDSDGGNPGSDAGPGGSSGDGGASASGPGESWARGGITFLAKGGLAQGGFVFASDVVSALGNGSTDAGLRALSNQYGKVTPLQGEGDGLSDSIPTSVDGVRPARVADGEAYIDPATVARIGGGDHAKGAKVLYGVMERVRKAAHGKSTQQRQVQPERVLS
jgi:hypothetical protein